MENNCIIFKHTYKQSPLVSWGRMFSVRLDSLFLGAQTPSQKNSNAWRWNAFQSNENKRSDAKSIYISIYSQISEFLSMNVVRKKIISVYQLFEMLEQSTQSNRLQSFFHFNSIISLSNLTHIRCRWDYNEAKLDRIRNDTNTSKQLRSLFNRVLFHFFTIAR